MEKLLSKEEVHLTGTQELAMKTLEQMVPFRYLDHQSIKRLVKSSTIKRYKDNEKILSKNDHNTDVYVILIGKVIVLKEDGRVADTLPEKSYFGERSHLLREPITHNFECSEDTTIMQIPYLEFKHACYSHSGFSMSLARSLREKQGIFSALDKFRVQLSNGVSQGRIDFPALVNLYRDMQPAIHHKLNSNLIDTDSWVYALKRLPSNITSTLTIIMSKRMTNVLSDEYLSFSCKGDVRTVGRRRSTWNLINGKIFVLIRDTSTDIIDFVSCLCLHQVEATKLRAAIKASNISGDLRRVVASGAPETPSDQDAILKKMKISENERKGLKSLWPKTVITEMYNILLQHGDYNLLIDQGLNNFNMDISEHWSSRVKQAALEALGSIHESQLEIDIISSNTHSVVNCLSPYIHSHKDVILEWGKKNTPEFFETEFKNSDDRLYGVCYHYFKTFPEKEAEREKKDTESGIITLPEEDFTGITVQIIIPEKILESSMDEFLKSHFTSIKPSEKKKAIINIDFAFGKQAEDIIGCLITVFRHSIKSVNIMGKAGGLFGQRGDILLPTHLIYQESDELRSVPNFGLDAKEIKEMSGRDVHIGPMLTILGTLLQNRTLLYYYLEFYKVVGLEMEASFFARQVERAVMMEILNYGIQTRFIYYVSDIPTDEHSTLSKSMSSSEGIPPLYTITRAILKQIFLRYKLPESENITPVGSSTNVTDKPSSGAHVFASTPDTHHSNWNKLHWALKVVKSTYHDEK